MTQTSALRRHVVIYLPVVVLCLIALYHFYAVQTSAPLIRWKGGGHGMYSEFHYTTRTVWFRPASAQCDATQYKQRVEPHMEDIKKWSIDPEILREAAECPIIIEVWGLTLAPDAGQVACTCS